MHEHAARGGAALARGADGAEHDGGNRKVQVGGFIHDDGVVAAELQQALAEPLGDAYADPASDVSRAGEGHECDAAIVDEALGELGAGVDEYLKDRRAGGAARARGCRVLHGERAQGGLRRGLPHRRVAADAARNAFHDHTATGKLNAEITPTTPSGCHCSYMRCCARSECMVLPYSMRD